MTILCQQLYQDYNHQGWNEWDLQKLPLADLRFLCHCAGIAYSGTKEKVIVRLLASRICRIELSKFADDPAPVAEAFSRDRLRWMCMQNNLWKSGNKKALAACLLMWRNRCRLEGQKFLNACIAASKTRAQQLYLPMAL